MDLPFIEVLEPAEPESLARWREGDAWLAGGTWLFSEPQPHLRRLLDLRAFAWEPLSATEAGLELAATCTLAQLHSYEPPRDWPAAVLMRLCPEVLLASWKVWNEASVGGNICLALPAGSLTALAAALDGVCTIWRPDGSERRLPVTELVTGAGRNALAPGELLRAVTLPAATLQARVALRHTSLTPRGRSAALIIGRRERSGATVITVTAAVTRPLQLRFGAPPAPAELAGAIAAADPVYHDDVHGDPRWRAHMTALLAEEVRAELQETG
jgi:CO/xanthine dehydrogenase FAD-binding subunit